MNIVFFDDDKRGKFLPLVYTKPICKLRIGILTIEEKWLHYIKKFKIDYSISYLTEDYLYSKYEKVDSEDNLFINSRILPTKFMVERVMFQLKYNQGLFYKGVLIAAKVEASDYKLQNLDRLEFEENDVILLNNTTDFFTQNENALNEDYKLITSERSSQQISTTNTVIGNNIFIEEGAKIEACVLNSSTGPIYIGKNAEVMEGSLVRGGLALCEGAVLKLGAKIYGPTTIGKYSKVGGEVNNSIIQDYSNKGHDGFLGNSLIGEWCNLGADTNTSNLKNNYSNVRVWDYNTKEMVDSGLQFCGLIMGDHSKCGINTMFNTGTTVGVASNIFDSGFPSKFVPSFSWGGAKGFETYKLEKMFEVAASVMSRREVEFSSSDKQILTAIFEQTKKFRK